MPGKVLILAGAPAYHRLNWTDSELLTTFQTSIAQFAQLQPATSRSSSQYEEAPNDQPDKSVLDLVNWRSLPLQRTHIHTGFSQQHDLEFVGRFPSSADFLTTADISFQAALTQEDSTQEQNSEEGSRILVEFLEHSFAVHDDLASSQIVPPGASSHGSDASVDDTATFDVDDSTSLLTAGENNTTALPKMPLMPAWGRLRGADHHRHTDLQDVPSAKVLMSLVPQTVTVNLIVCIISIAAPRIVETRYGTTSTLVEVLVGDETKSGFSVTFWLSPNTKNKNDDGSSGGENGVLTGFRSQDIVLMQNVALSVFRNKVYGGSLRRDMTKVHLLFRGRVVDKQDVDGYYSRADLATNIRDHQSQLEKTKKVREWVLDFVGAGAGADSPIADDGRGKKRRRKGKERALPLRDWEQPPPLDSQSRLG